MALGDGGGPGSREGDEGTCEEVEGVGALKMLPGWIEMGGGGGTWWEEEKDRATAQR